MPAYSRLSFLALGACLALPALAGDAAGPAPDRQAHIHHLGHETMPFALQSTLHVFRMSETGGSMRVVIREESAAEQLPLIQRHLMHMTARFATGDFSVPASLHGDDMPGLRELQAGTERLKVSYAPLADGGEIHFEASDIQMITAVHRWFGAQLSDHGSDAMAE